MKTTLIVKSADFVVDDDIKHFGDLIVYVERLDRPGVEDIIGDFRWRRTHEANFSTKFILEVVADVLKEYKLEIVKLKYSRKAGCSSCPCSPGYIGYKKNNSGHRPYRRLIVLLEEHELSLLAIH